MIEFAIRRIRVVSVRQKRDKPGLALQHLAAARTVAEVCDAHTEGLQPGATAFMFTTRELTSQAWAAMWLIGRLLPVRLAVEEGEGFFHIRSMR